MTFCIILLTNRQTNGGENRTPPQVLLPRTLSSVSVVVTSTTTLLLRTRIRVRMILMRDLSRMVRLVYSYRGRVSSGVRCELSQCRGRRTAPIRPNANPLCHSTSTRDLRRLILPRFCLPTTADWDSELRHRDKDECSLAGCMQATMTLKKVNHRLYVE